MFHLSFCFIICMIGNSNGSEVVAELQTQHGRLGECIEHLKSVESSRATLVTYLREALHEQVGSWFIVLKALCRFSLFFFVFIILICFDNCFGFSGIKVWTSPSTTSGTLLSHKISCLFQLTYYLWRALCWIFNFMNLWLSHPSKPRFSVLAEN